MYWATPNCLFLLKCRHSVHDSPPKILEITKTGSRCVHLGLAEGAGYQVPWDFRVEPERDKGLPFSIPHPIPQLPNCLKE